MMNCISDIDEADFRTALILYSLDYFKKISGRKRLQKIIYLVNSLDNKIVNDYIFYQYGPYSESVKKQLVFLVQNGIINEEKKSSQSKSIFEYSLTGLGKKYSKYMKKKLDLNLRNKTRKLFKEITNYNTDDLEIMTSLLFFNGSVNDDDALVKLVQKHKPRFTYQKIKNNLRIFDLLDKISE